MRNIEATGRIGKWAAELNEFSIDYVHRSSKSCKARDPKLKKYLDTVRRIEASFEGFSVKNIPRGENEHADLLAKSAA